jgi:hypothetical protein
MEAFRVAEEAIAVAERELQDEANGTAVAGEAGGRT